MSVASHGRVLLSNSRPRSFQSVWLKPMLLGVILGALVTQAFQSIVLVRRRTPISNREVPLEDPFAILGGRQRHESRSASRDILPDSKTVRNPGDALCEECESAVAMKELEIANVQEKLSTCIGENLNLLEADFWRERDSAKEAGVARVDELKASGRGDGKGAPKAIEVFVGIQSGYSPGAAPGSDQNYEDRRKAIRETWFRSGDLEFMKMLDAAGIVVKFVMGAGKTVQMQNMLEAELHNHDDLLILPIVEDYHNLVTKSREFFRAVMESYLPKYIVKVDDDVYLKLNRLPAAVNQWEAMSVDYAGCMKRGPVQSDPKYKWYEPQNKLLGAEYFTHCWGSLYVLSANAASTMLSVPHGKLRGLENEDVTVGLFMLATDMQHYDDRRLCMNTCAGGGIGLYDLPKPGLLPVIPRMHELHESSACRADEDMFNVTVPMVASAIDLVAAKANPI